MDNHHQIKSPPQPLPLYHSSLPWIGCLVLLCVFHSGPGPTADETVAPVLPARSEYSPIQTVLNRSVNAAGENEPRVLSTLGDSALSQQGVLRRVTGDEKGELRGGRALVADDDGDDGDDDDDDDSDDDSDNDSPPDSSLVEQIGNLLPALPPPAVAKAQPL